MVYLHTYIYHKNQPNAGKYTSPMDVMGNTTGCNLCYISYGIFQPGFSSQTGGPLLVKQLKTSILENFFFQILPGERTIFAPENGWLVQMYFLLRGRPFLGDIRSFSGVYPLFSLNSFFSDFLLEMNCTTCDSIGGFCAILAVGPGPRNRRNCTTILKVKIRGFAMGPSVVGNCFQEYSLAKSSKSTRMPSRKTTGLYSPHQQRQWIWQKHANHRLVKKYF